METQLDANPGMEMCSYSFLQKVGNVASFMRDRLSTLIKCILYFILKKNQFFLVY